ncbi:AAA family ATPase [Patulibacter sp.]|uniref:ATP-binding protein n=1 Tax=Patulibacter sp. TaxID=1912859 RepID=UPI0027224BA6|nr:AAA family ATPase [Patulibacter sp.]MDO9408865.1 AAA family ATPase [Patulibacter sp.]
MARIGTAPKDVVDPDGWPLLERDGDARVLHGAVAAARAGTGAAVLVRGSAGLGKTRLLDLAAVLGRDAGMTVLRAGGSVLERDFPFGVVFRLLEARLRRAPEAERARAFEGSASMAAPMLLGGQPVEQALAAGSDASLVHALGWVVMNLSAERPLVLVVDDLHWADALSIRLLVQLAAQIADLELLVVAATRPREPASHSDLLDQLAAQANVQLLQPRPLSVAASELLVRGAAPRSEAFAQACFEQTGGNPLLLRQLLRALEAEGVEGTDADVARVEEVGPEAVGYGVAATLARLGPGCDALATAVAVLADDTDLGPAATLADLDGPAAARAAAALQDAGLFDDAAQLRFRHPLLRRAVYDRPAPAARGALHRRAAGILRGRAPAQDVASHLLLAPGAGEPWAVEVLRDAARQASALAGHAAAGRLLRRALLEPPEPTDRPAVLEEAALAAARAGDEDAVPALQAAIEAAADGRTRARLHLAQARALYQQHAMGDSAEAADRGLAALQGLDGQESLAFELQAAWNASVIWTPGGGLTIAERSPEAIRGDAPARTHGERELLAWHAAAELVRGEDRELALRYARRAWADGAYLRESTGDAAAMGPMTSAMLRAGALQETLGIVDVLVDDARRRASPFGYAAWRTTRGTCLLHLGRLAEAESDLEEALQARALGWQATAPIAIDGLVSVLLEQDRQGDAAAVLASAAPLEDRLAGAPMRSSILAARGRHALASGDPRAALEHLLASGRLARDVFGTTNPAIQPWRSEAALAARELGDHEQAAELAAGELDDARRWGAPRALAVALRTQAVVVGGAEGIDLAAHAARTAEDGGVVLEQVRALGTLGALLRAGRRRSEAQEVLRRALDLAAERDAVALVRSLRQALVATGARPRQVRAKGPGALTAGERRVALLAADGLTNRQIADALFVTPKAVDFHLGNSYRKLGINSRRSLRDALHGAP